MRLDVATTTSGWRQGPRKYLIGVWRRAQVRATATQRRKLTAAPLPFGTVAVVFTIVFAGYVSYLKVKEYDQRQGSPCRLPHVGVASIYNS